MTRRVRVVINGIRLRVVANNRFRLVDDGSFRLVIRNVDDVIVDRCDLDDAVFLADHLAAITLQVSGGIRAVAERFDGGNDIRVLGDDRFTELPCPVEVFVQQGQGLGIVEQGYDGIVPVFVRLQRRIVLQVIEKALRLHELQREGRRRQHYGEEIVGIKRDGPYQLLQFRGLQQRYSFVPDCSFGIGISVITDGFTGVVHGHLRAGILCREDADNRQETGG